jgi:hypothetical protein
MSVWLLQSSMIHNAHLQRLTQKARLQVLRVNGGNTTAKMLFGIATHANIFIQWKLWMIQNGVPKQLDQMDQWKPLAGLMSTVTIFLRRQVPSILVKFGNFLTLKKESRLTFTMNIWAHFIKTWYILKATERYVLLVDCSYMSGWTNVGSIVWVRPETVLTDDEIQEIGQVYKTKLGWNFPNDFCVDRHGSD